MTNLELFRQKLTQIEATESMQNELNRSSDALLEVADAIIDQYFDYSKYQETEMDSTEARFLLLSEEDQAKVLEDLEFEIDG